MTSICKNTVITIKSIYNSELKPSWMVDLLLREIKQGIRFQRSVIQKDFLEICIRRSICTKEIIDIAKRVMNDTSRKKDPERIRKRREESLNSGSGRRKKRSSKRKRSGRR